MRLQSEFELVNECDGRTVLRRRPLQTRNKEPGRSRT